MSNSSGQDGWRNTPDGSDDVGPDLASLLRQIFPDAPDQPSAVKNKPTLSRNYETAFDLLERASGAFEALVSRCDHLEQELRSAQRQALADVEAANQVARQWQNLASALKMHLEDGEHRLAATKQKLDEAESWLAASKERASAAEKKAAMAMELTILFHDRIVAAFGIGSSAHALMDSFAKAKINETKIKEGQLVLPPPS